MGCCHQFYVYPAIMASQLGTCGIGVFLIWPLRKRFDRWLERYITLEVIMVPYVVVRSMPGERFTQTVETGKHRLLVDKQTSFGGSSRGPGYAYLLAALGS